MQIYWSATLPICSKHIRMSDAFFCVDASTKIFKSISFCNTVVQMESAESYAGLILTRTLLNGNHKWLHVEIYSENPQMIKW